MFFGLISTIKIIILLGFLIGIHETGHLIAAKLCKVKVKEFAIGFGPTIWNKQGKETKYSLKLIPLGGFVSMLGEEEQIDEEGSFSKAPILKRMAIVAAGAFVNIVFAIIIYFILALTIGNYEEILEIDSPLNRIKYSLDACGEFINITIQGYKQLFTGINIAEQFVGPVGISEIIVKTNGFREFIYILAIISMSLGITNLIPFPPLDGGKILFLLIEAVRRKPLKQETEIKIQLLGFAVLLSLAIFITYNDIIKII